VTGSIKEKRIKARAYFFGEWMPGLWCPPLTHYTDNGQMDFKRMEMHLLKMSRRIKAFLVPGSTSDGWELSPEETQKLLEYYLQMSKKLRIYLLIGVLRTNTTSAYEAIKQTLAWFRKSTQQSDIIKIMKELGVCGFAVCSDKGKDRTQDDIYEGLKKILQIGVPTALYQLPQMTKNEMSAETVRSLAKEFSNFYLFKDSSGTDKVALSDRDFGDVFLLRGAEGDYWKWQKSNGGPYDGFLLGSANCFAEGISSVLELLGKGKIDKAKELSKKVKNVVMNVSEAVKDFPAGNAFTNSSKAIDHFFAYGEGAINIEPPMLHAGVRLRKEFIEVAGQALRENGLMPSEGYVEK